MYAFFFYGTLLDAELREVVLGAEAAGRELTPAVLGGYRRVGVAGRTYPALTEDPQGRVDGGYMAGLGEAAAARISYYESDDYGVRQVTVRLRPEAGGGQGDAEEITPAWIFVPSRVMRLSPGPWDFAAWQRRFKARACANARALMARMPAQELQMLSGGWRARHRLPGVPQD